MALSGARDGEVVMARTELSEKALLSKAGPVASAEV